MSDMVAQGLRFDLPSWPAVDFAEFGAIETVPLTRIQKLSGAYLGRNWLAIPHVTHFDDVDITDLDARRRNNAAEGRGKLTILPCAVKALAALLKEFPKFNASLDSTGQNLVLKKYCHVGVAVDTPMGLLVAVVRDCDRKSVGELAVEIAAVAAKARAKGLSMKEMVGGSMTVSSLGHIGGTAFTPIINAPEVAILGLAKTQWKPTRDEDGGVAWRAMLPVSLSYDHRVIDGADAARFVAALGDALTNVGATAFR